jgi:hypothetical protein
MSCSAWDRKFVDSPLEESGFETLVPVNNAAALILRHASVRWIRFGTEAATGARDLVAIGRASEMSRAPAPSGGRMTAPDPVIANWKQLTKGLLGNSER